MQIVSIDALVRGASRCLAQISCGFLIAIVLITTIDTGMRYLFSRPIGGSNEIIEILLSFLIMFAIPFCTAERAHIRVDLLDGFLGPIARRICDIVIGIAGVAVLSFLSQRALLKALEAHEYGDTTIFLSFPQWTIYGVIGLSAALYALILIWQTFRPPSNGPRHD